MIQSVILKYNLRFIITEFRKLNFKTAFRKKSVLSKLIDIWKFNFYPFQLFNILCIFLV